MARRPKLSKDSFLAAIFHPKTAARPTGLRKRTVSGIRGGRKASRVRAYNNLDPLKQQILNESGNREAYLHGNITLAEARHQLRPEAIAKGIAKPLTPNSVAIGTIIERAEERPERDKNGYVRGPIKVETVRRNVSKMTAAQKRRAEKLKNYAELYEEIQATLDDDGYSLFFYK